MERIRERFNNAIALEFVNIYRIIDTGDDDKGKKIVDYEDSPYELFDLFFKEQNGREMTEKERNFIKSIIESLEGVE